ncbi:GntR family transcriptional regulator [Streptomyces sp. A30]|uniref:GntR family transcriptional regulator n=1 Tax=Streptomyces sp. A30 TaxID=2789273 RepID=UPI00397EE9AD
MDANRTGEGGGAAFQRVFDELRARIADETYPVRGSLPSQRKLAEEFGVSRDTMQRVLRELARDGLIESRQGSGSRVLSQPAAQATTPAPRGGAVRLERLIRAAFEEPQVTLDVATLSSESLDAHVRLQVDRVREREIRPERVAVRMLLPSEAIVMPYPRAKEDPADPRPRERLHRIANYRIELLRHAFGELEPWLDGPATFDIRRMAMAPTFKLYLINGVEAVFAPYKVIEGRIVLETGEELDVWDVEGLGASMTRHVRTEDPLATDSVFVTNMQAWFDSVWYSSLKD